VPGSQEEVIWAREVVAAAEAARVMVVHVAAVSARQAAMVREGATTLFQEVETQTTITKREAWETVLRMEVESATMMASTHGEAEGFDRRTALLEGELMDAWRARDTAEANPQSLSSVVADVDRREEEAERDCWEWVQELTLLQTQGSNLCQAIVGPLKLRGHLSNWMRIAAACHTEMVEQLTALQAVMSSAAQSMLGHSPTKPF
jgi:hypothetical protein